MPARELGWVAKLLLRVGADATVLDPPGLADDVRELAQKTLDRYGE
jgi:predicted DNA-binding transcriptional regulator YafY